MSLVSYVVFTMVQATVIVVYYILCYRYTPWTALAPALGLNAFVHVVMHFYYGYTVYLGTSTRPVWKKRITELQVSAANNAYIDNMGK